MNVAAKANTISKNKLIIIDFFLPILEYENILYFEDGNKLAPTQLHTFMHHSLLLLVRYLSEDDTSRQKSSHIDGLYDGQKFIVITNQIPLDKYIEWRHMKCHILAFQAFYESTRRIRKISTLLNHDKYQQISETLHAMEFFLNRVELSLNSGNLKITEAWIGLNLKILSLHVSCWCCGSILGSHAWGGCVAGSSPFTVIVTEFNEFSETFRKNSNVFLWF